VATGDSIVIAADRVPVGGQPGHTLAVPFLAAAPLPIGPWCLRRLGCPVYWLSCLKADGRYTLQSELLFDRIEMPRAQRARVLTRVMTVYAQRSKWLPCRTLRVVQFYPFGGTGRGWHLMLTASAKSSCHSTISTRSTCVARQLRQYLKWRAMN